MNVIEVVDVPQDATEDEARVLLNRPCEVNRYMLVQVFPLPDGRVRAFYRLASRAYDIKMGKAPGPKKDADGMDTAARALIAANDKPGVTLTDLVDLLAEHGIKRGKSRVGQLRIETRKCN